MCSVTTSQNKPELVEKARELFKMLKKEFGNVAYDDRVLVRDIEDKMR